MLRLLYNLVFPLVIVALLPGLVLRMWRRGKYRHKFGQRFGFYSPAVRKRLRSHPRLWIHAVSVGEVNIALKLIDCLRARNPRCAFVLSTTTSTGFHLADSKKSEWLEPIYNPLDFWPATLLAFDAIRPTGVVLVEAEVWPNLVGEAKSRGLPVVLVNARLSPRSEARFRRVRWLAAPLFNRLDALCLQEPADLVRWEGLGLARHKLHVTGSIKFDSQSARPVESLRPLLQDWGVPVGAPVLIGGSTFPGEEAALVRCFRKLQKHHPDLFLILVPRHAERADSVLAELTGFRVGRRSETPRGPVEILLVDTTGELPGWYAASTIAFVGKSLCAEGGQNPAEPLQAGIPVLFGPHMKNFDALASSLVSAGGALCVVDEHSLESTLNTLLGAPDRRRSMVEAGRVVLASHHDSTTRTAVILENLLSIRS